MSVLCARSARETLQDARKSVADAEPFLFLNRTPLEATREFLKLMKIYKYLGSLIFLIIISGYLFNGLLELIKFISNFPLLLKLLLVFTSFSFPFLPAIIAYILWQKFIGSIENKKIRKSILFLLLGILLPIISAFITYMCLDVIHLWILKVIL